MVCIASSSLTLSQPHSLSASLSFSLLNPPSCAEVVWCAQVFDSKGEGSISAEDFKKSLPLMGEEVPEERINQLFTEADTDGSGMIEFPEFVVMVKGMNPKVHTAHSISSHNTAVYAQPAHTTLHTAVYAHSAHTSCSSRIILQFFCCPYTHMG